MFLLLKLRLLRFVFVLFALILAISSQAKVEAVIGDTDIRNNSNLIKSLPITNASEIIISREQYVISYNKIRHAANWVAWKLEINQLGGSGRTGEFFQDQELEAYLRKFGSGLHAVNPEDYRGSCLDRGHLVPSGDRTDSLENNRATFQMTNMIPQTAYLNRVLWEHLEAYARNQVRSGVKKIFVVSGPIYDEDFGAIGPKKEIPIPSKSFKVIFLLASNESAKDITQATPRISVIMPNRLQDGSKPKLVGSCAPMQEVASTDVNDWRKYQAPLAEIERISGLKFSFF